MEDNLIVLEDENGNMIDFEVIDVYELDGVTYFALVEAQQPEDEEEFFVTIMRVEGEDDEAELVSIESDAELEAAFNEFVRRDSECGDDCDCHNH